MNKYYIVSNNGYEISQKFWEKGYFPIYPSVVDLYIRDRNKYHLSDIIDDEINGHNIFILFFAQDLVSYAEVIKELSEILSDKIRLYTINYDTKIYQINRIINELAVPISYRQKENGEYNLSGIYTSGDVVEWIGEQ